MNKKDNMRKLILLMHTSLDSLVNNSTGGLDWVTLGEDLFNFVNELTNEADTALYGKATFEIMENYWPNAADKPNATKHDIEHSSWYNKVSKIVLSKTLKETSFSNTKVISNNLAENINQLKQQQGKNILMFGSPSAAQSLIAEGLIDEFWLFQNPIILGQGIPLFKGIPNTIKLKLLESKTFPGGVIGLHYAKL